jgi:branched-chain amino acid transport system permease protein
MGSALVSGVTGGADIALMALGLVLVYKTTRTFNFAQGEFGTLGAYVAYAALGASLPYWAAIALALLSGAVAGVVVERLVVARLRRVARVYVLVATAGVALAATAIEVLVTKNSPYLLRAPVHGSSFSLAGVTIPQLDILIVACSAGVALVAWVFFRLTMLGAAVLAEADDHLGASTIGLPAGLVSGLMWAVAGLLGALAGLLLAPQTTISPGFMTAGGLVYGLTAVVVGGLDSVPGAFVGSLVVGLVQSGSYYYLGRSVPGVAEIMTLALLLVVLLARGTLAAEFAG